MSPTSGVEGSVPWSLRQRIVPAALLSLVIFAADLEIGSRGLSIAVLYVVPLLLGGQSAPRWFLPSVGILVSTLAMGAALIVLPPSIEPVALANRVIAIGLIWAVVAILSRVRATGTALLHRTKDLEDVKYAIDQSAIVATTDVQGSIRFVNDKFCEISKYSRAELLGQDHRILNSGYHAKDFMRTLWRTIAAGRIWRGEIRNRAKDGSFYWVDTTIVPFLDSRRKPYQYMAIRYDITDRKRSEDLLREQAALARLGEMSAIVAHEVKNPIAGIRGALQVIASRMTGEPGDRAVVSEIIGRLDALNGIVADLLLFARPRAARTEPVEIRPLLAATSDLLHRDPAFAGVDVHIDGDDSVVHGDREQLQIVFQNVLMNAAQSMAGEGRIDVSIGSVAGGCRVSIKDAGPGMPSDIRQKAFDPFFTTKHRGTGLGLPIARRIVEGHGGQIDIDGAAGEGTTVSILLPSPGRENREAPSRQARNLLQS